MKNSPGFWEQELARNDYFKILWLLRFEKIKKAEETAAWRYQEILNDCLLAFGEDHEIVELLRQLIREERVHAKLAEELLRIGYRTHPECDALI